MKARVVKDQLNYLLFSEVYHRLEEPKAKRRALTLLEAAIECFSRKGFENVSLEMIAREAGSTRPLLRHYFKDLEDVRITAMKYIRLRFQKLAVDAMQTGTRPSGMLSAYIDSCFFWQEHHRTHAKVWLAFMHLCAHQARHRELNTEAVVTGEERIAALLEVGKAAGEFQFDDAKEAAKTIQSLISGAMVTIGTENLEDEKSYARMIRKQCLRMLGMDDL